jgi:hypothetical protein
MPRSSEKVPLSGALMRMNRAALRDALTAGTTEALGA